MDNLIVIWKCIIILNGFNLCLSLDELENTNLNVLKVIMPNVTTKIEDEYWLISHKLNSVSTKQFIVKMSGIVDSGLVHHMLVYGCGSAKRNLVARPRDGGICDPGGAQTIIFAWGKNADPLSIPENVGVTVGENVGINYLVLEVHYNMVVTKGDSSGIEFSLTDQPMIYNSEILVMMNSNGRVPPKTPKYDMTASCFLNDIDVIYPFAFRVHAHDLARVIYAYFRNSSGVWYELGRGNPQWPQTFYPVKHNYVIKKGDLIVAKCIYNSINRTTYTSIGSTHTDEMCNFYLMYYKNMSSPSTHFCSRNDDVSAFESLPVGHDEELPENPFMLEKASKIAEVPHDEISINTEVPHDEISINAEWSNLISEYNFNPISGVSVGLDNSIYVFHRAGRSWTIDSFDGNANFLKQNVEDVLQKDVVAVLDGNGTLKSTWGKNMFYLPHGIHIDLHGNVWLTDVALHQVFKFNNNYWTKPALVLGERFKPSSKIGFFCKPTAVATLSNGDFFVADGYCNSRILKYNEKGVLLKMWGKATPLSRQPRPGEFSVVHALALLPKTNTLCVADRENGRIQCFDMDGNFRYEISRKKFNGQVYSLTSSLNEKYLFMLNGVDNVKNGSRQCFIVDLENGNIVKEFGNFSHISHDIALSTDNKYVYVAEIANNSITKFDNADSIMNLITLGQENNTTAEKRKFMIQMVVAMISFIGGTILLFILIPLCKKRSSNVLVKHPRNHFKSTPLLDSDGSDSDDFI